MKRSGISLISSSTPPKGSARHWPTLALSLLLTLPLESCDRVAPKANAASVVPIPVRTAEVVSADVPLEIAAVGNVEAMNSVDVKSRLAGEIKTVAFSEGQNVIKGQLLFRIDRETLERQFLEEKANLERDAAMERQAHALVARDIATEKQSRSEADVARQLGQLGVLSGQRVSQLVTTTNTAEAALQADQAAAEAAAGTTRADRARLAQTELQMQFTEVVAPINGRAGAITVNTGNMVRDNDATLVTLRQLAPIYVAFGIPEQRLPDVRRLDAAGRLVVNASPDTSTSDTPGSDSGRGMEGHLAFIDNAVNSTTGTIRLKAAFPNTDNALWPGEFVRVRLRLGMEMGRIVVPESAIQAGIDGKFVWVVRSGIVSIKPVSVLRTYRPASGVDQAVIDNVNGGIKAGEVVVTEGQLRLTAGASVSELQSTRADALPATQTR